MVEPIARILWNSFTVQCGMVTEGQHASLRRKVGPSLFQAVTRLVQLTTARVSLQHLQAPAQARCQAQGSMVIEPAVIKVVRRHPDRKSTRLNSSHT